MIKIQVKDNFKWVKCPEFEKNDRASGFKTKKTVLDGVFLWRFSFLETFL